MQSEVVYSVHPISLHHYLGLTIPQFSKKPPLPAHGYQWWWPVAAAHHTPNWIQLKARSPLSAIIIDPPSPTHLLIHRGAGFPTLLIVGSAPHQHFDFRHHHRQPRIFDLCDTNSHVENGRTHHHIHQFWWWAAAAATQRPWAGHGRR